MEGKIKSHGGAGYVQQERPGNLAETPCADPLVGLGEKTPGYPISIFGCLRVERVQDRITLIENMQISVLFSGI